MTTKCDMDAVFNMIEKTYFSSNYNNPYKLPPNKNDINTDAILNDSSKIKLKEICVYPIKSCGSYKVHTKWPLTSRGLKYDREWMIVTSNGVCMTQKTNSRLCLITPIIDVHQKILTLQFPFTESVSVPLHADEQTQNILASLCQSKVCGDRIQGIDCGDAVADWLSDVLCTSDLRLIRQSSTDTRMLKANKGK